MASSQLRDRTRVPCTGRWIPNHWTTREINHIRIHVLENLLWVEPRLTRAGKSGDRKALRWTWHGDPGSDMEGQEGDYAKEDPSFLAWATGCP